MRRLNVLLLALMVVLVGCNGDSTDQPATQSQADMFQELLGKSEEEVQAKIDGAWEHFFYGNDNSQRVYYPVGDDMAYVADIGNGDVRSEGISYGMMIAVQMDKQEEFDRIWKWAKTHMYHEDGQYAGYFAWHTDFEGNHLDANPASDGETWITTALFFAAHRWGNGEGIFDYEAEANALLQTMLHKDEDGTIATPIFNSENKLIVFVPTLGRVSQFSDPSYHTPHYFDLWAEWAAEDNETWREVTEASRAYLPTAAHPETCLMPDYADFDGKPVQFGGGAHDRFAYDAWRTTMNIAVDYAWNQADEWQVEQVNCVLEFFYSQGIDDYRSEYTLDGEPMAEFHGTGLVAINGASAAVAGTLEQRTEFVQELWDLEFSSGQWRYYDGLLHFMSLLIASGNFNAH